MKTDTTEKGLEALIVAHMTGRRDAPPGLRGFAEDPEPFAGLDGWLLGDPGGYDRAWTVDLAQPAAMTTPVAGFAARLGKNCCIIDVRASRRTPSSSLGQALRALLSMR